MTLRNGAFAAAITLALFGCSEDEVKPFVPIDIDDTKEKSGEPERTQSSALSVDEQAMTTRFDEQGATVVLPIDVADGAGQTAHVTVWLTTLDQKVSARLGQAKVTLEKGKQDITVTIADEVQPEQGEQAGYLVRYRVVVDGRDDDAYGQRSLYYTLPKYGLRVWAPQRLDAGATTFVRVWLRDLTTDTLIAGQDVSLNGVTQTTDVGGQAEFEVSVSADATALDYVAAATIEGATVTATRAIQVVPEGAPVIFVSTDKPLYRPGQTIHIRALALAQKNLTPVGDTPVTIEVLDGKSNKIFKEDTVTDAFGVASLTAPLASQVNLGGYTIRAIMADIGTERMVEVSEEKLPKFAVTLAFDEAYYKPGATITGALSARYFFGKAVAGATVTMQLAAVGGGRALSFTDQTNDEGLMPFELPNEGWIGVVPVSVEVTDSAGFKVAKEASFRVHSDALQITLVPETQQAAQGAQIRVYATARDVLGRPTAASCTLTQTNKTFEIPASGVAQFDAPAGNQIGVGCATASGVTGEAYTWVSQSYGDNGLLLRTDKAIYAPGEKVIATVIAPEKVTQAWIDRTHRGRIVESWTVALIDGTAQVEMAPHDDESGTIVLTGFYFDEEQNVINGERLAFIQRAGAEVTVTANQPTYLPGAEAELTFEVKDKDGKGQAAAIGVTIADEAVFALAGSVGPNDVQGHFLLDDAPAGIKGFALLADTTEIQLPAQAALAQSGFQAPATVFGVTAQSLQAEARQAFQPPVYAIFQQLRADVQEAAEKELIHSKNAEQHIQAIELYDFWGQRIELTAEVQDKYWGTRLYVTVKSLGPDELPETWDDLSDSIYTEIREKRQMQPGDSPAGEGGSTGGGDGGFSGADAGSAEPGPAPPSDENEEGKPEVKKRQDFPETLYVNPALITDSNGQATVTLQMADAITEWRVSMIANTANGLVGGGQGGITVFQDFFVDADLPRKLTANDTIMLPIGVFNFSDEAHTVTVTVSDADWFVLNGSASQEVVLQGGQSIAVPFAVTVKEAGHHSLEVVAQSATFADGVIRTVQVMPDGQRIDLGTSGPLEGSVGQSVTFPADAISGGNDAFIKLMGGPGAQMVDGIDALLSAPRGCFEPMMNSTWINALVLQYMDWTNTVNPELVAKAKANLADGYQQCATFECEGGGFTWFGAPDPGHPILTAFGLQMFNDFDGLQTVDAGLLNRAQEMLVGLQDGFGGWHSEMGTKNQALPWDELRSSCVVAWGLAVSGYDNNEVLAKGMEFIKGALDLSADTYTMAMCANALLAISPEEQDTDAVIAELLERAQTVDGLTFWNSDYPGPTQAMGEVISVETTALVAQALFSLETPPAMVEGALKYLASKKSPDGNFMSTQGTIQAMRAFVAAAKFAAGDVNADVVVKVGDETIFTTHIDDGNSEVVHLVSLTEHAKAGGDLPVTIEVLGEGKLYYQVASRHYVPWNELTRPVGPLMDVAVTYSSEELSVGESTIMTTTVTSSGPAETSDMPMVDIGVPPGFDPDLSQLDELVTKDPNVARYEQKGDRLVVYLHSLPKEAGTAFEVAIPLSPRFPMTVTTPSAKAYKFYEPQDASESLPTVLTVN